MEAVYDMVMLYLFVFLISYRLTLKWHDFDMTMIYHQTVSTAPVCISIVFLMLSLIQNLILTATRSKRNVNRVIHEWISSTLNLTVTDLHRDILVADSGDVVSTAAWLSVMADCDDRLTECGRIHGSVRRLNLCLHFAAQGLHFFDNAFKVQAPDRLLNAGAAIRWERHEPSLRFWRLRAVECRGCDRMLQNPAVACLKISQQQSNCSSNSLR
jgi:hypothetical protein